MSRPVALITGATRGLGLAIARELAPDYHIIVGGRDRSHVNEVCASLPSASPFIVDLSDLESIAGAFAVAMEQVDRLDVLVHNAGVARRTSVANAEIADWQSMLTVNVMAVAELTKHSLPALREAHGTLLTINSGAGVRAYPADTPYTASKWALRAFTECLRDEERGRIRVSSIHPGRIDTDMQRDLQEAAGITYDATQHMPASEVAKSVRWALSLPNVMNIDEIRVRTTEAK